MRWSVFRKKYNRDIKEKVIMGKSTMFIYGIFKDFQCECPMMVEYNIQRMGCGRKKTFVQFQYWIYFVWSATIVLKSSAFGMWLFMELWSHASYIFVESHESCGDGSIEVFVHLLHNQLNDTKVSLLMASKLEWSSVHKWIQKCKTLLKESWWTCRINI